MTKVKFASAAGSGFGLDDLPVAAAYHLRIFESLGLEVEWIRVKGGVKAMETLVSKDATVAYGGYGAALASASKGNPLKIVASTSLKLAQELVGKGKLPLTSYDPVIRWGVDGIGAMSHQLAREIANAFRIPESGIQFVVSGPPEDRIQALLHGDVDATLLRLEESDSITRSKSSLVRILTFEEINHRISNPVHGVIATTTEDINEEPDVIQKVVRGIIESNRALSTDFSKFERAMNAVSNYEVDLASLWERCSKTGLFAVNGGMNPAIWKSDIENYFKMNTDLEQLDSSSIIYPRFVAAALNEIGKFVGSGD